MEGRERLSRVRRSAATTAEHTAAAGCEAMDRQLGALSQALEQWEGAALRARDSLEGALACASASEEEYERLTARLDEELKELDGKLRGWGQELIKAEGRSSGEEAVEGWQLAKVMNHGSQNNLCTNDHYYFIIILVIQVRNTVELYLNWGTKVGLLLGSIENFQLHQ